jgi:hypothetical protein
MHKFLLKVLLLVSPVNVIPLYGQTDLVLQDLFIGKAEVSATGTVTLSPSFHAKEGSNFHAFIGSSQPQNSSSPISSPSDSTIPAAGSTGLNYIKVISYREPKQYTDRTLPAL